MHPRKGAAYGRTDPRQYHHDPKERADHCCGVVFQSQQHRNIPRQAEAITYAACGTIIGFVLGLLLHYLIYVKIIVTHFGGTWKVPVVPMEIIVLLVLVSCILAVYAPAKRIRNMAITATINEL